VVWPGIRIPVVGLQKEAGPDGELMGSLSTVVMSGSPCPMEFVE
jgi:hypothetical protein